MVFIEKEMQSFAWRKGLLRDESKGMTGGTWAYGFAKAWLSARKSIATGVQKGCFERLKGLL